MSDKAKTRIELVAPCAFEDFTRNATPANAVRLAIADHKAQEHGAVDWHFVRALERAVIVLEGNAKVAP